MTVWIEFALCLFIITMAGYRLCIYGDVLAEKLKLSRSWVGVILLASVTSLPELATGISAVAVANSPDIAVGDVLGSCVFNLMLIVVLDFIHRTESVYTRAHIGHTLSAGFGVVLIGFVAINLLLAQSGLTWQVAHVGLYTPLILILYALSMRTLFRYEQSQMLPMTDATARYGGYTLRQAGMGYAMAASAVVMTGIWLPFVGKSLAQSMGWAEGFVGTLFIATVTSLPEAVVTLAAVRLGVIDLALGNLLGSNLFNIGILAVDDLFYLPGPLLSAVSASHTVSALSAMMMSGIAIIGLFYRPRKKIFRTVGWTSLFLMTVYLLNTIISYLSGN